MGRMVPCLRADIIELWLEGNALHVTLSPAFRSEIHVRQADVKDWDRVRREQPEKRLSTSPPRLHNFLFMSCVLPMMAYKDPFNLFRLLDTPVYAKFLQCVWDTVGKALDEGEYIHDFECVCTAHQPDPDIRALCLRFPKPVCENEVYMAVLVAKTGKKRFLRPSSTEYSFYTFETGLKEDVGLSWYAWLWDKGKQKRGLLSLLMTEQQFVHEAVLAARNGWK